MSKVAILVLGSYAPLVLDQVVTLFDEVRFKVFLHVDAKQDLAAYIGKIKNLSKITLIQNPVEVFWGGFSMVEAEIALIEAALQYPDISNLILISDDSAPLASPDGIYQALMASPDRIACVPNGRPRHWYDSFFYSDSKFSSLRGFPMDQQQFISKDFQNVQRLEQLRLKGKKELSTIYFGRQWWALARSSVMEILRYIKNDDHFVESFRFSLFPDEIFFPTAYRACFLTNTTLDVPTYADYGRHVHPWIYTSAQEIWGAKFGEEHLFVRKIQPSLPEIVVALAENPERRAYRQVAAPA